MSALADWYDRKIIPHPLDTNDVSSLGSIPTGDITLCPGAAVPNGCRHTGTPVAGLHLCRFIPNTVPCPSSLPDSSSSQTHHLPLLHPGATRRRTSVGPVGEVPVGYTGAHVALLSSSWANPGVALLLVHLAALIADAAHAPRPPPDSTVH